MHKAKLTSGKIVEYDFADSNRKEFEAFVPNLDLTWLGKGTIHSIDGVRQKFKSKTKYNFWKNNGRKQSPDKSRKARNRKK